MRTSLSKRIREKGKPKASEPVPDRLLARALNDPLVKKACEIFSAEIVEIQVLRLKL
jgi:hypothetical protein